MALPLETRGSLENISSILLQRYPANLIPNSVEWSDDQRRWMLKSPLRNPILFISSTEETSTVPERRDLEGQAQGGFPQTVGLLCDSLDPDKESPA